MNKPIFSNCAPAQNVQFHVQNSSTTNAVPTLVPPSNHALPTVQTGLPAANLQSFFDTRLFQESLPKLNLECFSGDPLKWPEWKGMFQSTCCHPSVSNDHKMRYLKLFTAGKAKATIEGFGFGGNFFEQAFAALQRRFGSPHLVVGAQIDKMSKHPPVKMHNSEAIIEFSQAVDAFVSVLSSEQYFSDLQSSSNLSLLVSKLPINLREQWFAFTENSKSAVNLVSFRDWLQKKAMIHERLLLSSTKTEKCEQNLKGFGEQTSLQLVSPTQPINNEITKLHVPFVRVVINCGSAVHFSANLLSNEVRSHEIVNSVFLAFKPVICLRIVRWI